MVLDFGTMQEMSSLPVKVSTVYFALAPVFVMTVGLLEGIRAHRLMLCGYVNHVQIVGCVPGSGSLQFVFLVSVQV